MVKEGKKGEIEERGNHSTDKIATMVKDFLTRSRTPTLPDEGELYIIYTLL